MTSLAAVLAVNLVALKPATVSLDLPGVTLSTFVERLSEETGRAYSVDDGLKREVLAVRVRGMEVGVLQQHVADVVYGKWEGDRLVTDEERIREGFDEYQKARLVEIRQFKRALGEMTTGKFDRGEIRPNTATDVMVDRAQTVPERIVLAAVAALPDEVLLSAIDGGPVSASTRPNPSQVLLPSESWISLVDDWIAETNKIRDEEIERDRAHAKAYPEHSRLANAIVHPYARNAYAGLVTGRPVKYLLYLKLRMDAQYGFSGVATLVGFDAIGQCILQDYLSLSIYEQARRWSIGIAPGLMPDPEPPLSIGDERRLDVNAFQLGLEPGDAGGPFLIRQSPRECLLGIVEQEGFTPLGWRVGPLVSGYAKAVDVPVVACLVDEDDMSFSYLSTKDLDTRTVGMRLSRHGFSVRDGVLVRKAPIELAQSRRRVRGEEIAEAFRLAKSAQTGDLGKRGEFMAQWARAFQGFGYGQAFEDALISDAFHPWSEDRTALQLWGLLTEGQRVALRRGERVGLSLLSPEARGLLKKELFEEGNVRYLPEIDSLPQWVYGEPFLCGTIGEYKWFTDWRDEPTEVMPRGLPDSGYLELSVEERSFFPDTLNGDWYFYLYGLDWLCNRIYERRNSETEDETLYQRVDARLLQLNCVVGSDCGLPLMLIEKKAVVGAPFSMSKVPRAVQVMIEEEQMRMEASELFRLRQEYDRLRFGG